ncbi:MAG TPA: DNA double-strand break repair nuclease NurA, partial [Anaerolineaceae bacterium]|nr:DNA double-strand break repair nuclease NurA [Anaerolineaceae bacterium]
ALLEQHANDLEHLAQLVEIAAAANSGLRCAIPLEQALNSTFDAPVVQKPIMVIAADGSQISPDRHAAVEYGVINLGAIHMWLDENRTPEETTVSRLLYHDALHDADGNLLGEDYISLKRDLEERRMLAELARAEKTPVVALTDGPLELYGQPQQVARFHSLFEEYLQALAGMAGQRCAPAGYVDKPRADLVVRLLELTELTPEELSASSSRGLRRLQGVRDLDLFAARLQPGQRTAVFGLQSGSRKDYTGALALHFFYLNVGTERHPTLARVEIPAWVANNPFLLDQAHAVLVHQSRQIGARRYPYALHRAHEIAVVHFEEREQLETMIQMEMRARGLEAGERSNKQSNKDLPTSRTRYE